MIFLKVKQFGNTFNKTLQLLYLFKKFKAKS